MSKYKAKTENDERPDQDLIDLCLMIGMGLYHNEQLIKSRDMFNMPTCNCISDLCLYDSFCDGSFCRLKKESFSFVYPKTGKRVDYYIPFGFTFPGWDLVIFHYNKLIKDCIRQLKKDKVVENAVDKIEYMKEKREKQQKEC